MIYNIVLYISHHFFIHSPINRNVGCLYVLDMFACIVNNATMNKGVQMYSVASVFIFFGDRHIYTHTHTHTHGLPWWLRSKASTCNAGDLGWDDPLEEGMTTHYNILAWRIPMDRSLVGYSP